MHCSKCGSLEDKVIDSRLSKDDPEALLEHLSKVFRRPAAGYLEGFQAAITAIKANEAVLGGQKVEFKSEWYQLG